MIDAKSTVPGKYFQNGQSVTLSFYKDTVVYTGTIKGQDMSGSAQNGEANWTWSVTKQSSPVPAPAPLPSPSPAPVGPPPSPKPAPVPGGTGPVAPGPIQTGPTGPVSPGSISPAPAAANKITPENLAEYLKKLGYQVQEVKTSAGPSYCVITVRNNAGWNFVVEVRALSNGGIWLVAPLTQVPAASTVSSTVLLRLLESSDTIAPCFFFYRAADSRICMKLEVWNTVNNNFQNDVTRICNAVQQTHPFWNQNNFAAGQPVAAK